MKEMLHHVMHLRRPVNRRIAFRVFGASVFGFFVMFHPLFSGMDEGKAQTLLFVGDDEEECDEACEGLSIGEQIAHLGTQMAMTAVSSSTDYESMLNALDLLGSEIGEYSYSNGHIINHVHDGESIDDAKSGSHGVWGSVFDFGEIEMPNEKISGAKRYIDFTMGNEHAPGYAVFANCAAMPPHCHWALGHDAYAALSVLTPQRAVKWGGDGVEYNEIFDDEWYWYIPVDASKTWEEQCRPGDYLGNGKIPHYMLYIGNRIAQTYFPETTGYMGEAGASSQKFWGISECSYAPSVDWLICRPKGRSGLVPNQEGLPEPKLVCGCVESGNARKHIQHEIAWVALWCAGVASDIDADAPLSEPNVWPWNKIDDERLAGEYAIMDEGMKKVPNSNCAYASCNQAACCVLCAVVDMDMAPYGAASGGPGLMEAWLESHPDTWEEIFTNSVDELQPGDVFVINNESCTHTAIWIGNDIVKERYPTSSGDVYQAGYRDGDHAFYPKIDTLGNAGFAAMGYRVFRVRKRNDASVYPRPDWKTLIYESMGAKYAYQPF